MCAVVHVPFSHHMYCPVDLSTGRSSLPWGGGGGYRPVYIHTCITIFYVNVCRIDISRQREVKKVESAEPPAYIITHSVGIPTCSIQNSLRRVERVDLRAAACEPPAHIICFLIIRQRCMDSRSPRNPVCCTRSYYK